MSGRLGRHCRPVLASPQLRQIINPNRGYAMIVARVLRGALKLRYILLGSTIGGGVAVQKVSCILYFCAVLNLI